jgi:DNA-binding XRE family transcriptional regulator
MIRTDSQYRHAKKELERACAKLAAQHRVLFRRGVTGQQLAESLAPLNEPIEMQTQDIALYDAVRIGDFTSLNEISHVGRLLIGARIFCNLNQRQVAELLEVTESTVSYDERHEYANVTCAKAQRIAEAMGMRIRISLHDTRVPYIVKSANA